ncbi:MAG TPA: SET domain-containing protein-lysine N-methyltransferase [Saprospiraceae bacterium]|nr:SET domain-containing protein-lysine N-methyltransferase [Saprospiraceae bacterium]
MRICVLQPDYSTSDVDYKNYDPPRDLRHLLPKATFDHVLLNKLTTHKQLRTLAKNKYDIFVNLCEGYLDWSIPSIDVVYFLEQLNLPFTGPTSLLYDPPKELMKYVAYVEGISTPAFALVESLESIEAECAHLKYPLFVKPHQAGDSLGIDQASLVRTKEELHHKCGEILEEYGPLLVEEYIEGREFTVMLVANAENPKSCSVFKPIEYIFPSGFQFKTYALKTSELHPEANIPCNDPVLERKLKKAALKIFQGFGGVGYARLDFRVNAKKEIYFLEINFTCSVFYKDGYEGSADYILKCDGIGQAGFLKKIIAEGIARHRRRQKKYVMKGNAIAGYGIYATQNIAQGEIIFKLEGSTHRIITRKYVEQHWNEQEKEVFRKYAYPLSKEVFALWDDNPSNWAPQNHCCDANTEYEGLNVVASRPISKGDELTLNYASFLDDQMEPFQCQCGAYNCSRWITGIPNNSVTTREEVVVSREP